MTLSAQQLLAAGRVKLLEREPYMAHAVMSLVPREKPGMCQGLGWGVQGLVAPFAVSDGLVMLYDPEVIEQWAATAKSLATVCEWVAACIAHEAWHPMRNHSERRKAGAYHPLKWNRAADMEINDDLVAAGYIFPPGYGVLPSQVLDSTGNPLPDGKLAEEYYRLDPWSPGDDSSGTCAGGSGAGNPHDDEPDSDPDARSSSEQASVRRQTAKAIKNHAKRSRGSVPGGLERWADEQLQPPVISWQSKIRTISSTAIEYAKGMVERSTSRLYRRQAALGFGPSYPIMPGWHAPKPEIVVVIDTSGSMSTNELTRAVSETVGILEAMDADIVLMTNDANISGPVTKVNSVADIKLGGGGGTDFRPPFEYIKDEMRPTPSLCVFFTDGMGPAHASNPVPHMHTIWVGVGPYKRRPWGCGPNDRGYEETEEIGWGEYIEIEADDIESAT